MPWVRFDDEDRRSPAPHFRLDSVAGQKVALMDFCGHFNLVILFCDSLDQPRVRKILRGFPAEKDAYRAEDARLLVITPQADAALVQGLVQLGEEVTLLSDPAGATRSAYAGLMDASLVAQGDPMLFVLDRYGAPYTAVLGAELDDPALHEDVLKWLQFIGLQCPE